MKHAKVQHSPKSMIALVLAIAMLISAIPFTAVADGVDYYNATTPAASLTLNGTDSGRLTDVENVSSSTALTSEISGGYFSAKMGTNTTAQQIRVSVDTALDFADGKAILFYFQGGAIDNTLKLGWGFEHGTQAYLNNGATYYTLEGADKTWETKTTSGQYMAIPANFSGWIRVPHASFGSVNATQYKWSRLYFGTADPTYAFTFGTVMVVDAATSDYYAISTDSGANTLPLYKQADPEPEPEPEPEPDPEPADPYNVVMSPTAEIASGDRTAGRVDANTYEYPVTPTSETPYILGSFAKFKIAASGLARLTADAQYSLTADHALMFYIKNTATDEATTLGIALESSTNSLVNGKSYYLLEKGSDPSWEPYTVTSAKVTIPAGFEGWIRLPHDSFATIAGGVYTFRYTRLTFDTAAVDNTYYIGAISIVEDVDSLEMSVNGSPVVSLFPNKTISKPDGVSFPLAAYYGCENMYLTEGVLNQALKVTVDDIASFVGCKLYYQYKNEDGETIKIALLREGSAYHGTANAYDEGVNNTAFYIPALRGATDAQIVADTATGTPSDNATVVGIRAVYYVDEAENVSYINEETGKFTFEVTARVAREVVDNDIAYDLKHVKLTVAKEGSTSSKTYDISMLSDRCGKYAEFVKPLSGSDETARYSMVVEGVYEDENGNEFTVTSDVLTGQSIKTVVANDGIIE